MNARNNNKRRLRVSEWCDTHLPPPLDLDLHVKTALVFGQFFLLLPLLLPKNLVVLSSLLLLLITWWMRKDFHSKEQFDSPSSFYSHGATLPFSLSVPLLLSRPPVPIQNASMWKKQGRKKNRGYRQSGQSQIITQEVRGEQKNKSVVVFFFLVVMEPQFLIISLLLFSFRSMSLEQLLWSPLSFPSFLPSSPYSKVVLINHLSCCCRPPPPPLPSFHPFWLLLLLPPLLFLQYSLSRWLARLTATELTHPSTHHSTRLHHSFCMYFDKKKRKEGGRLVFFLPLFQVQLCSSLEATTS